MATPLKYYYKFKEQIDNHIKNEYPKEGCGFILKDRFVPIPNISPNPTTSFEIALEDSFIYLTHPDLVAIIHSHTIKNRPLAWDIRTPSLNDINNQKTSGVPWLIMGTEGLNIVEPLQIPRTSSKNYLKRPFIWFINDCWTLVQDFYLYEFKIKLKDSSPPKDFKKLHCMSGLFNDKIESYGFEQLPFKGQVKKGDLLLVDHEGYTQNHLVICLGDGQVLHQAMFSKIEPIENFIGHIHFILRYKNEH